MRENSTSITKYTKHCTSWALGITEARRQLECTEGHDLLKVMPAQRTVEHIRPHGQSEMYDDQKPYGGKDTKAGHTGTTELDGNSGDLANASWER